MLVADQLRRSARPARALLALLAMLGATAGCASSADLSEDELSVVTTTGILADLVQNVAGDRIEVTSIVPEGGDPHSYEPSLRDVRAVAYADAAFSNYVLLEGRSIIRTLDANLRDGVPNVGLAEASVKYAAEILPLVENVSLDTVWLGMRVRGTGDELGATRADDVRLYATEVSGPGNLAAYLTETFGRPAVYVDDSDGIDSSDSILLPPDAHTHMSWAFTETGVYRLTLAAELVREDGSATPIGVPTTFTFAVGVDAHAVADETGATVLRSGHGDVTVDLGERADELYLYMDSRGGGDQSQHEHAAGDVVIEVPNRALHDIPVDPAFRFLGRPGDQIHQLPQAVLGAHVHGEIDPHLWQDVGNAQAYVEVIRDTLIDIDPDGAATYRANATAYLAELDELDSYVSTTIAAIPESNRYLVTTHDAFGYLGAAYDVDIAGFVTPNPSTEPSIAERQRLVETISNLHIPAVFLEPNLIARSSTLVEVANDLGIEVCRIYSDAFDTEVTTYIELMRANADSLHTCLT